MMTDDNTNEKNTQIDLSLTGIKILIADDVDEARHYLSLYLERKGATVFTAENGAVGLDVFKQQLPDVVITDIKMPVLSGLHMAENIRLMDEQIPIIFITAYNEIEQMHRSINLAVTDYLIKPITPQKLRSTLQKIKHQIHIQQKQKTTVTKLSNDIDEFQNEKKSLAQTVSHLIGRDVHPAVNVLQRGKDLVRGDFHCVIQHQQHLYVFLADGMGHGLTAILPALDLPKVFRELANKGFGLPRIIDDLNTCLADRKLIGHFIAVTLARIDFNQGFIEVVNCGNPDVLLVDDNGSLLQRFQSTELPLGIVSGDDFTPQIQDYHCRESTRLYLSSDGLTELVEKFHSQSSNKVLCNLLSEHEDNALNYLDDWLHTLTEEQIFDDVTLLEVAISLAPTSPSPSAIPPYDKEGISFEQITQQPQLASELKDMSILLVEDDDEAHYYLSHFLSKKVGKIYNANNGQEGLQLYIEHQPKLIISDVSMPVMNGLEMASKIRKIDPHVPIILTSGHNSWTSSKSKLETVLELTINKFLPKPLDHEKLLEAIQYCFQQYDTITSLQLSASLFMTSPLAMTVTDLDRNFIAVNPAFTAITGYKAEEIIGCNPRILSSGKHDAKFYKDMWNCINDTGHWNGEVWNRRKNGDLFLEWINITAIYNLKGELTHYASIFSDITQRTYAEEKVRHLAHHDALTNLPNRTLFFDRLEQSLLTMERKPEKLAIIYLDIDHFKTINDTLGHSVGDKLICAVTQTLKTTLRESDTVSRLGGDEFAILLSNIQSEEAALHLIGKIFHAVSKTYSIASKELRIGLSMGVSLYPQHGKDAETLVKRADTAMYQAKKNGRNRYEVFNYALETSVERQMNLHQALHVALEKNELYVHYQPKYAVDKQAIIGAEALLRWKNEKLGELSPAEFIPIAEETGLIIDIGNWLINQVCEDIADWKRAGLNVVPIAVNISPVQFHRGCLKESLSKSLFNHRLPASLLQIELTEGVVMDSKKNTLQHLQEIKDLGIKISIDDFGTGYSSLSYLRQLPIDELKIDRSFISEILDDDSLLDTKLTAIPSTIIELAQKLQLTLVAEGVETSLQRDFLQQKGCNVIQGYLFCRPINKDSFQALLENN